MRHWLAVLAFLAISPGAFAQNIELGPRTVQLESEPPSNPLKIAKILIDGVEITPGHQSWPIDKPGVPFQAADDWFNHIGVVLKNISPKNIVYVSIQMIFLEPGGETDTTAIAESNAAGQRPRHARYSVTRGLWQNDPPREPILIKPGQEFILPSIDPDRFEEAKEIVESRWPLSQLNAVRLAVTTAYFEDGIKWGGGYFRPDYSGPGKYVLITREEFEAYHDKIIGEQQPATEPHPRY